MNLSESIPPDEIERRSFAIIEAEIGVPPFAGVEWEIARRMIHASADFSITANLLFHPRAVDAGIAAIQNGAAFVVDVAMLAAGITAKRRERFGNRVECLLCREETAVLAKERGVTRTAVATEFALKEHPGAVFVVGNAPTALLKLLEEVNAGAAPPALVVGMPVGFVNAAESKALLAAQDRIPFITLSGRKGGSPLAAACVNALLVAACRVP